MDRLALIAATGFLALALTACGENGSSKPVVVTPENPPVVQTPDGTPVQPVQPVTPEQPSDVHNQ